MNIDAMPAGPEMDRLIEAEVLKEKPTMIAGLKPGALRLEPGSLNNLDPWVAPALPYSMDIEYAWRVVAHLRLSRGLGHMTTFDPDGHGEEANCCVFRALRGVPGKRAMGIARDMPLAICRAALKAVQ